MNYTVNGGRNGVGSALDWKYRMLELQVARILTLFFSLVQVLYGLFSRLFAIRRI